MLVQCVLYGGTVRAVFSILYVGTVCAVWWYSVCAVFSILNVGTVCVLYLVYCMLVQPVCAIFSILFGGTVCMLNVSTVCGMPGPCRLMLVMS